MIEKDLNKTYRMTWPEEAQNIWAEDIDSLKPKFDEVEKSLEEKYKKPVTFEITQVKEDEMYGLRLLPIIWEEE